MKKYFSPIIRFFNRLHNVYRWFPTIWKDQDWDDSYITYILIKKLEHQRDFFLSHKAYSAVSHEVAEQIQTAINGLERTSDMWVYEDEVYNQMIEKWGKGKIEFVPNEDGSNTSSLQISYEFLKTEEDKENYHKELREGLEKAHEQYIKDKQEVYKYIADNIDKWWD